MKPGTYNLSLYRGDTFEWRVNLWQDSAQQVPVNLAGSTAKAQWRDRPGGSTFIDLPLVITLPNTIDLAVDTVVWNHVPPPANGVWDLQITDANSRILTVLLGSIEITQDVTVP